jgi:hypothetical protein
MPELTVMKPGTYIFPPETISTAHFINPSPAISNTNTAASQIVEIITLILIERLNQYL